MIDCAYQHKGANGCSGAPAHSYLDWADSGGHEMADEAHYPYQDTRDVAGGPNMLNERNGLQLLLLISNKFTSQTGKDFIEFSF